MSEAQFTVENVYTIRGRGVVLLPGVTFEQYTRTKVGDTLVIRRPDGSVLHAVVRGVEYPPSVHSREPIQRYGVLVDLHEVPVGSTVTAERRPG
jgi:hypothetical protein